MIDRRRGGSYLCPDGHELRVTKRCQERDLEIVGGFAQLEAHPIVQALVTKRSHATSSAKTVGPAHGHLTLYHLGEGDDHRGATWHDQPNRIVWLCAYGVHRSGTDDDAFQVFDALIKARKIYPDENDYVQWRAETAVLFAGRLDMDASALLERAKAAVGSEVRGRVGPPEIGVLIEIVETLEETYVAMSGFDVQPMWVPQILAALYPHRTYQEWLMREKLPTRELQNDKAEFCFGILHDADVT